METKNIFKTTYMSFSECNKNMVNAKTSVENNT